MSDNIPFDIQVEIIKRIGDVKSLIRFRSVSKPWKSLISSSQFIAAYHMIHHTDQSKNHHHLLVSYADLIYSNQKYVSIVDDHDATFPQHKFSLTVPECVKLLIDRPEIVGSSRGLFCFRSHSFNRNSGDTVVIWNPSIRKAVAVNVPQPDVLLDFHYKSLVGFGVCPHTSDSMLVKISYPHSRCEYDNRISSLPWQAEVFTLKSGAWRSPSGSNLPRNTIQLVYVEQVVTDEFIYWLACDRVEMYLLIISFNLTTEEFEEIRLPRSFAVTRYCLSISKLRESLVVLERLYLAYKKVYGVWRMDHGVPKSFTKLYNISTPESWIKEVLGFTKTGEAIIVMTDDHFKHDALFVYEPYSKHIDPIGIYGKYSSFFASSYMETLLLLDQ